MKMKALK